MTPRTVGDEHQWWTWGKDLMRRPQPRTCGNERSLPVAGVPTPVEVRRHPSARRMTLRISRTRRTVVVTLPAQCGNEAVAPFVTRHLDWVRKHLGCLPDPVPFRDGALVPLRGELHQIVFAGPRPRDVAVVERMPGAPPRLIVAGPVERAPRRLIDWLIEEARRDIDARVMVHGRTLALRPKRIAIRDQVSRWGSCSTTGALAFSWRLVLAPSNVLDYVAAHEVAHLAEMNHGPRFWALCRKAMPEMDAARDWLRTSGIDLHRYGVSG